MSGIKGFHVSASGPSLAVFLKAFFLRVVITWDLSSTRLRVLNNHIKSQKQV